MMIFMIATRPGNTFVSGVIDVDGPSLLYSVIA